MHFPPSAKHGARLVATSSCAVPPLDVLSFRLQEPQVCPMALLASFPRTIRCCKGGLALSPFPLQNLQPRTAVHISHTFKGAPPQVHPIHRKSCSFWSNSLELLPMGGQRGSPSHLPQANSLKGGGWVCQGPPRSAERSREARKGGQRLVQRES